LRERFRNPWPQRFATESEHFSAIMGVKWKPPASAALRKMSVSSTGRFSLVGRLETRWKSLSLQKTLERGDLHLAKYFFIALGGALGSLARFWVGSSIANRMGTRFPYGTFVINITACLIIGFSMAFLERRTEFNPAWRFLIPIGFVGAYSTFSTFEWETFSSLQTGAFFISTLYVVLSFLVGLIAVWCGVLLARAVA